MIAVCPHCGQETDGALPFCQYCGQRLAGENGPAVTGLPSWLTRASASEAAPAPAAPASAPAIKAQLVARLIAVTPTVVGQTLGREFPLDGQELLIGRAPNCAINLDGDPMVSRVHAKLRSTDGGYTITDLGSSNGTLVNDEEIHGETPLREGDELTIGECRLRIASGYFEIDTSNIPQSQPAMGEPASANATSANGHDPFAMPAAPASPFEPFPIDEPSTAELAAPPMPAPEPPAPPPPPREPEPEELRDQMAAIGAQVAQQARKAIQVAEHYRNALEDSRQRVGGALAQQPPADSVTYKGDLNSLRDLVRQVVENPQHLQFVTQMSMRANELAAALETLNATEPYANLLGALEELRQRLDEALALNHRNG